VKSSFTPFSDGENTILDSMKTLQEVKNNFEERFFGSIQKSSSKFNLKELGISSKVK